MEYTKIPIAALKKPAVAETLKERITAQQAKAAEREQARRACRKADYLLAEAEKVLAERRKRRDAVVACTQTVEDARRRAADLMAEHERLAAQVTEIEVERARLARLHREARLEVEAYEKEHPEIAARNVEVTAWTEEVGRGLGVPLDPLPEDYAKLVQACSKHAADAAALRQPKAKVWEKIFTILPDEAAALEARAEAERALARATVAFAQLGGTVEEAESLAAERAEAKATADAVLSALGPEPEGEAADVGPAQKIFSHFETLIQEIADELARMRAGGGLPGDSATGLDALDGRLATITSSLNRLRDLAGSPDDVVRLQSGLVDLADGLHLLADAAGPFEAETLIPARIADLLERGETAFAAVQGGPTFEAAGIAAYVRTGQIRSARERLERFIAKKDLQNWPAVEASAAQAILTLQGRIQDEYDAKELIIQNTALKKAAHEQFLEETKAKREAEPNFLRRQISKLINDARDESITPQAFEQSCAELRTKLSSAEAIRDKKLANERGEFFYPDQWRSKFGITSDSGYVLLYSEDIVTPEGDVYELHFRRSNDALAANTDGISLVGGNPAAIFDALFVNPIARSYRMHATCSLPGGDNAHIYFGDGTLYRDYLVPASIHNTVKQKLEAMLQRYKDRVIGIISGLVLPT